MKTSPFSGLALGISLAACQTAAPTSAPTTRPTPTPVPAAATELTIPLAGACAVDQIEAIEAGMPDPGYVSVRVRRTGGDRCVIRLYPATAIVDAGGLNLVESRPAPGPPEFYPIEDELLFDLAWSVECPRPAFQPPLTAWIAFVEPGLRTPVPLPEAFVPECLLSSPGMGVGPAFTLEGGTGG